jgi:hypothetical protein
MSNSKAIFGSVDISTGEIKNGYIDKFGQMQYKKLPWYKRIFQKRPEKTSFLCNTQLYSKLIFSDKKHYFDTAVYKTYNPYTNEIYSIFCNTGSRTVNFDVESFIKTNQLIIK